MTDQLLEQVRELAEGQIVSIALNIVAAIQLIVLSTGLRGAEAIRTFGDSFTCCHRGAIMSFEILKNLSSCLLQAIAFIVGYILQDITLALYISLGGTALVFIIIVPPWPFYNTHPVKWLPVAGSGLASQGITVDGKIVA